MFMEEISFDVLFIFVVDFFGKYRFLLFLKWYKECFFDEGEGGDGSLVVRCF